MFIKFLNFQLPENEIACYVDDWDAKHLWMLHPAPEDEDCIHQLDWSAVASDARDDNDDEIAAVVAVNVSDEVTCLPLQDDDRPCPAYSSRVRRAESAISSAPLTLKSKRKN